MIATFHLNDLAQTSAVQIAESLMEGTLIALFAGLTLRVASRQSSGTKFAVWFSALMAIAMMPFFSGSLWPRWRGMAAIHQDAAVTLPGSWAMYAAASWVVIAGWFLLGIARGLWHLRVLRKSGAAIDASQLDPRLQETLERNAGSRRVSLRTSELVRVPTAIGLLKPAIVLPRWVLEELSTDEIRQVLLHEVAHIRRWDDWTNLAQKLVKALFFFHPAVWWIERQVSLEREMACDDAVIAETASPRAYAECLTLLAERTLVQRSIALAQAALGRIRHTSLRVAQILDGNRDAKSGRAWKPAAALVAGFALACGFAAAKAPRLIAFSDGEGGAPAASTYVGSTSTVSNVPVTNAVFHPQPLSMVPAAMKTPASPSHRPASQNQIKAGHTMSPHQRRSRAVNPNLRLTKAKAAPVAVTETFFVVVEDGGLSPTTDQPIYRLQMWRITLFHPVVDPDSRIPRKQI